MSCQPGTQRRAVDDALADDEISTQLASGSVVVVVGRANLAESTDATIAALQALLAAVPHARVLPVLRRGNVVGALSLGLAPTGHDAVAALRAAADGRIGLLVLLGADPLNDHPDADLARRAMVGARRILSIDTFPSESTNRADVVLAAAAYGEKSGTTTNVEGRVSPVARKVTPRGTTRPDWMIAVELASLLGSFADEHPLASVSTVDDVTAAIAATVPEFAGATPSAVAASPDGVVVGRPPVDLPPAPAEGATRNSYDYRLVVSRKLYDRAVGTEMSRSLSHLAPGEGAHVNPLDLERIGVADGDDVRIVGAGATVVLAIRADPTVPRGTLWAPFNQGGRAIEELIDVDAAAVDVRIERVS